MDWLEERENKFKKNKLAELLSFVLIMKLDLDTYKKTGFKTIIDKDRMKTIRNKTDIILVNFSCANREGGA